MRSFGRILATIWDNEDFISLDESAQRLYMFLVSQRDLSHAGLMPLRLRKWARKAKGMTVESLGSSLDALIAARFVVVDEDTEELLIRTMVRNDGIYKQPKLMIRLREDAAQIESKALRSAFIAEIQRLPMSELSSTPGGKDGDQPSTREVIEKAIEGISEDFRGDCDTHPDTQSDTHPDTPRVRARAFPQPPTPIPSPHTQPPTPVPPTAGSALAPLDADAESAQSLIAEWIDRCAKRPPGNVIGIVGKHLKQMLGEGMEYGDLRGGLELWSRKGLNPSSLPSVVHEFQQKADKALRPNSTTNDRVNQALALAQRFAQEAS